MDKTKYEENVSSLEVVEVALVQCSLVDNQYQQKFGKLYTFAPNKSYAYFVIKCWTKQFSVFENL